MIRPAPVSTGGQIILGLLVDEPSSGYQLAQRVERSVAHFWPITKAHVYAELPKLSAAGFAVGKRVPQRGVPDKVLFTATKAGREAFRQWLRQADLGIAKLHHPLLLKVFFTEQLDPGALAEVLDQREAAVRETMAHYDALLAKGRTRLNSRQWTLRYGTLRLAAELVFIEELRAELRRR